MASGKIKGITIEIGGDTTKLGKAIGDSEKQTRSLQGELKQVDKLLKFDPSNTELLTQKQNILTASISETSKKLDILKEAEAQVIAQFERGEIAEDQMRAFQREIMKAENDLNGFQAELSATVNAMGNLDSGTTGTVSALDKLSNTISEQEAELSQLRDEYTNVVLEQGESSEEAKRLASQMETLNTELGENKKKLGSAQSEADKFSDSLNDVGDSAEESNGGFTIMKGALADLTANAIQGAISAIGDFIGSLFELSEATEEYRQMQAKLEGSSKSFGYSVDFANEKYKEFYKYVGDDQMATNAITNLMGIGTTTDSISKLAEGATAVWASYGDSIPIESLTESINETITVGKVTGTMADTINWAKDANVNLGEALSGNKEAQKAYNDAIKEGLPVEDAFNEALAKISDEQERADVVARFLNDTYGESKKTYDELSGSILEANEAELDLKDTQAELGQAMEPVNTAITDLKDKALEAILPIVKDLAEAFMDLLNWLQENPGVMKIVTASVIALGVAFGILAGALAIQGIITGVTKAIGFLNTTLLANPIVLIVALIAGLVAGFIYLWNTSDSFRQFWINLWESIKSITSIVVDAIIQFFTVTIPEAWNSFLTFCSTFIESIVTYFSELPGRIWTFLQNIITDIATWGTNLYTSAVTAVQNMITSVIDFFNSLPYKIGFALGFVIGKLILFGQNAIAWVTTNVPIIINNIVTFFSQLPGKIWTFLVKIVSDIATWGVNMKDKAVTGVTTLISSVITFFSQLPTKIWNVIVLAIYNIATWGANMKSTAVSAVTSMVSSIFSTAQQIPGKVSSAISGAITAVVSWGSNMVSRARSAMGNVASAIKNGLSSVPGAMLGIGRNIVEGLWNGISNMVGWITGKVKGFAKGILNGIKSALDIHSPSRVMRDEVGKYIAEGIGVGITENADNPIEALESVGDDMINSAKGINGITLNRQLENTFTGTLNTGGSINDLVELVSDYFPKLIEASKKSIVLDSGTLIGETINQIDERLANNYALKARGI